jgi:hypothetical protein
MMIKWHGILPNDGHIGEICFKDFVCPTTKSFLDFIGSSPTVEPPEDPESREEIENCSEGRRAIEG